MTTIQQQQQQQATKQQATQQPARKTNIVYPAERHAILVEYIKKNFHLTPVNWIPMGKQGICSCWKGEKCASKGKHPRFKGWQDPASPSHISTQEQLERSFPRSKLANWGLVTGEVSGVFAIDIDKKSNDKGKTGYDTLAELEAKHGALPSTLTATTGSGGKHILFRYPTDGRKINNNSGTELGHGIDVRGDRGFICVFPSRHNSGNLYRWDSDVATTPIAEAPEWLLKLVTYEEEPVAPLTPEQIAEYNEQHAALRESGTGARRYAEVALQAEVNKVLQAGEGRRNATLNSSAYSLGRFVPTGLLTQHEVHQELLSAAIAIGLTSSEANATIQSGMAGGYRRPKMPPDRPYCKEPKPAVRAVKDITKDQYEKALEENARELAEDARDPVAAAARLEAYREKCRREEEALLEGYRREAQERREARERLEKALYQANRFRTYYPGIYHRCKNCPPGRDHRPCAACAKQIGVIRDRPSDSPCTRGGCFMVRHKDRKRMKGALSAFKTKCCMWGCSKCGYDNECDHLIHLRFFSEWMKDILDQPKLCIPSKIIDETHVREVNIQSGVWKAVVPETLRRRYSTKLSKLKVYFVCDYIGNNNYVFFIFLPNGFDAERLNYNPTDAKRRTPVEPELISFFEFQAQHRLHIANAGRHVRLSKTEWELCDQPDGARVRHVAVSYCRALAMPKRMVTNDENEFVGRVVLDEQGLMDACREFGAAFRSVSTREIDQSHTRGFTMLLMNHWQFTFSKHASDEQIDTFIDRVTGRDRSIEPAESPPDTSQSVRRCVPPAAPGSIYLSVPLVT